MNAVAERSLAQVIQDMQRLPALRAVVLDVLRSLESPQTHLAGLAQGISRDVALSASVLRVVNSPFYGLASRVGSVQQAALILGTSNLRGIITAAALVNALPLPRDGSFDPDRFWMHSFTCAVWARLLAERARESVELCYTAGLLHDVGKIVLAIYFGELCSEVARRSDAEGRPAHEIERELLGFDHARVGAELLAHWRLPERLRQPVAQHHTPPQHGEDAVVSVVRTADRVAHLLVADDAAAVDAVRVQLRLPEAEMEILLAAAQRECAALRSLLHAGGEAE